MAACNTILMVRPVAFGYNEQTASNNFYQSKATNNKENIQQKALAEFDNMVAIIRSHGINVVIIQDTFDPVKPDAVFPNNWLSTSPDGQITLYPMFAANRRTEKREDILQKLEKEFNVTAVQDWSEYEVEGRFLEGTGSMIIDHESSMIYAAVSERTNISVLEKYAATNNYQAVVFLATDKKGRPIYHTNVMMALGEQFCILCEEAIEEEWELIAVRQLLESTNHAIIPITRDQMNSFAGNMLEVKNNKDEYLLILSQSAFDSLRKEQKRMLEAFATLVPIPIPTIEKIGGGSVRCMITEIFLEKRGI